ncbi:MAG: hypothetical protein KF819_24430 [Labilithrix sp.]|nr:hypothetical protein [Labilithrix sp.]
MRAARHVAPFAIAALAALATACGSEDGRASPDGDAVEGDVQEFGTGPKLAYEEYTVLFTNPVCRKYAYGANQQVTSNAGETLTHKPENVFCAASDGAASSARDTSPQKKLIDWIRDPETTEIFFTYLSFSNKVVGAEICKAVEERNVKVTFVLDRETDLGAANTLLACQPGNGDPNLKPRMELRGHDATIGYAHNKVFMINPRSASPRIVFSSGNLSSGVVLHHENWHFLRVPARTHFAKAHVCMMDGMLDHYRNKQEYGSFIRGCRDGAGIGEESDIKTFFVPGDGGRAGQHIRDGIRGASSIRIAAHRFSYSVIRRELDARFAAGNPPEVKLVADDDIWWAGHGAARDEFPNTADEFGFVEQLKADGLQVRYMETNHAARYLHHNKFIVFKTPQGEAAFAGAGNFTGTAFTDNFENFYWITIPSIVKAMKDQHDHLWSLGTPEENLPTTNILPPTN